MALCELNLRRVKVDQRRAGFLDEGSVAPAIVVAPARGRVALSEISNPSISQLAYCRTLLAGSLAVLPSIYYQKLSSIVDHRSVWSC